MDRQPGANSGSGRLLDQADAVRPCGASCLFDGASFDSGDRRRDAYEHPGATEPGNPGALEEERTTSALTLLVMDVSFISATLLLEPVFAAAPHLAEAVILVKPQFEAGREHVGKGGIVRDPAAHQYAIDKVAACAASLGWEVVESIPSPITGVEGNREFLLYAKRR